MLALRCSASSDFCSFMVLAWFYCLNEAPAIISAVAAFHLFSSSVLPGMMVLKFVIDLAGEVKRLLFLYASRSLLRLYQLIFVPCFAEHVPTGFIAVKTSVL